MTDHTITPREYAPGIGVAVADRTINRTKKDGTRETWAEVARRVALGNSLLDPTTQQDEERALLHHISQASLLMSGRHLQHGDATQPNRPFTVFSNCSTTAFSFLGFYLLLNGSGVGRCYDDAFMLVDWSNMPTIECVIDPTHADVVSGEIQARSLQDAYMHRAITGFYSPSPAGRTFEFEVPDSREGWAQAIQEIEELTFLQKSSDVLLLDFSKVRCKGSPIAGMQDRPASGPGPLMQAINRIATLKGSGMPAWLSTMYVDHYLAECVLVGGARRASRIALKHWKEKDILEYIGVKKTNDLWSANNSVAVDKEFWEESKVEGSRAREVFDALTRHAYYDQTGEPGTVNVDRLQWTPHEEGYQPEIGSKELPIEGVSKHIFSLLVESHKKHIYQVIVNPCSEIALSILGGFCIIADLVPFFASSLDDAVDSARVATRALIRVNQLPSVYSKEVKRTNRIGIGLTGVHEFAWNVFGFGWHDLVNEAASLPFWQFLNRMKQAINEEAKSYSAQLGMAEPHSNTCFKPSGSVSKLFNLTEGAHLPARRGYLRWVQFREDDPLVEEYKKKGYPWRGNLTSYKGTTIIGFPTMPLIGELGMGDKLVTAPEATPVEQYEWVRLLEKYWLTEEKANNISYTLKFDPGLVSYEEFCSTLQNHQSGIKCCSVLPVSENMSSRYEYLPEENVTEERYHEIVKAITAASAGSIMTEDVDLSHVDCAGGACPVDFKKG